MASSDNIASIEPWMMSLLPLADTWMMSDLLSRDTETFTKAFHKSLSGHLESFPVSFPSAAAAASDLHKPSEAPTTPPVSGISGSDPDTPAAAAAAPRPPPTKRRQAAPAGRIAKRKSRAAKRTQTTFITADVAHFRQMVQEVTGVRLGNGQLPVAPVIKPEPHRPAGYRPQVCLPTLDTSAFLLDTDASQHYHHQLGLVGTNSSAAAAVSQPPPLSFPPAMTVDGGAAFEFDSFCSFPTLESWKVM